MATEIAGKVAFIRKRELTKVFLQIDLRVSSAHNSNYVAGCASPPTGDTDMRREVANKVFGDERMARASTGYSSCKV